MGDYMYMFSYDRQALGDLFDFFLELRRDGKNVYILAGNHDWLNQHFVYHEGKKVADILNDQAPNKLYFITEPETHTIE
jgi:DNA repair exonuclease SbcCD nuclease subunit